MKAFTAQEASEKLSELVEDVLTSHKPVVIFGKHKNVVLVSESDWTAMSETMHLLSKPGIRSSIRTGMLENVASSSTGLRW